MFAIIPLCNISYALPCKLHSLACRYNFCYVPKYYNGTGYLEKCTPNNGTTLPPYNGTTPPPPPNNTCPEEPPESDSACDSIQDVEECKYGELVIIVYITAMLVSYWFASVCNLGLLYLRLRNCSISLIIIGRLFLNLAWFYWNFTN